MGAVFSLSHLAHPRKGPRVIYVSKNQLSQVEYLIGQSIQGNHVLFDSLHVRRVFEKQRRVTEEDAYAVEPHIEKLLALPTLSEQRAYLGKLDEDTLECVVLTYFNIVENNLFEKVEVRH